ncbi:uncharacterized protein LOC115289022 isoform X2 [Suricata suricatta]|uniref:uncharacterized protein LOC115289022 isoform X2 n=1 Tax=Suricata suricatta TaxID=37032 RepID=UPI001155AB7F|nr:uncharacterized protein LOC115289022 isoform X2 [Suricata suricatta]
MNRLEKAEGEKPPLLPGSSSPAILDSAVPPSLWGSPPLRPEPVGQAWAAGGGRRSGSARTRGPSRGGSGPRPLASASAGSAPKGASPHLDWRTPAHPNPRRFDPVPEASRLAPGRLFPGVPPISRFFLRGQECTASLGCGRFGGPWPLPPAAAAGPFLRRGWDTPAFVAAVTASDHWRSVRPGLLCVQLMVVCECGGCVVASPSSWAPTLIPSLSCYRTAAGRELTDLWKTPPHSRKKEARSRESLYLVVMVAGVS